MLEYYSKAMIRRRVLVTTIGKVLVSATPEADRLAFLQSRPREGELVISFLRKLAGLERAADQPRVAHSDVSAISAPLPTRWGGAVAAVGVTWLEHAADRSPEDLGRTLLEYIDKWKRNGEI